MITVLYPIYNLYKQQERLSAFNKSINALDDRFNIVISDTGDKCSKEYIVTNKHVKYIWQQTKSKEVFNKSITINNGFNLISDELFIILDAEILLPDGIYSALLNMDILQGNFLAITKHLHCDEPMEASEYSLLLKEIADKEKTSIEEMFNSLDNKVKNKRDTVTVHNYKPGRFLFTNKKTFEKIKFDETYIGYGGHDYNFLFNFCKTFNKKVQCLATTTIHLYHPNNRKETEKEYFKINNTKVWEVLPELNCNDHWDFMNKYFEEIDIEL